MVTLTVHIMVDTDFPQEAYQAVNEIFLRSPDCWALWESLTYCVNAGPERDTIELV